jgi:hypothetical protein
MNLSTSIQVTHLAGNALTALLEIGADFPELAQPIEASRSLMRHALGSVLYLLPVRLTISAQPSASPRTEDESPWDPQIPRDATRCKALLFEVLKRAASDYVLYKQHSKMLMRELAEEAHTWLFLEDEDHANFRDRENSAFETATGEKVYGTRSLTSFLSICDYLDLSPGAVRKRVLEMDVRSIISAGRPAENRKIHATDATSHVSHSLSEEIDMDSLSQEPSYLSNYESYGYVPTMSAF